MGSTRVRVKKKERSMTDNIINFEDYKKKNEGEVAPAKVVMTTDDLEVILAKVQKQKEQIEKQKKEIAEQREEILKSLK